MLRADVLYREITKEIERIDAQCLFAHFLNLSREKFIMHPETEVTEENEKAIRDAAKKIHDGLPTPYIVGKQAFWGRDFYVNENVLIPRTDTETLIECVLNLCQNTNKDSFSILDLGTGSGVIAITLALELKQCHVTATDMSDLALLVAKNNANRLLADVTFLQGSWYEAVSKETFDVICSNPPYIESHDSHLRNLTHEPIFALTDGGDGLGCIREILSNAKNHLNSDGWLFIEHGYNQGAAVRLLFASQGFSFIETRRDLGGNERITFGTLRAR